MISPVEIFGAGNLFASLANALEVSFGPQVGWAGLLDFVTVGAGLVGATLFASFGVGVALVLAVAEELTATSE
ncbi:hypothetical protein [Arthrobacter sp. MYb213]|uniref:hypothetical protein n=1 Tax=Arthrobacter sp. MYb213 TaxID=1848595 RepID=UPI000CFBCF46|nr:hypothetical protein [Arthrobacter sp. MYb213]PRB72375.1 hypothetical protein CQ011_01560 [Arthrobacter sp. MYb213]